MKKIGIYHRFIRKKGIYTFAGKSFLKLLLTFLVLAILVVLAQELINDLDAKMEVFFRRLHPAFVVSLFFISESFLGLLPSDFVIIWAGKMPYPWFWLFVLAIVSYFGGLISYKIGRGLHNRPRIRFFLDQKLLKYFDLIKKYGGFLIFLAALLPIPYSPICISAGLVKFPFSKFVLLSIARIVRYPLYALVLFKIF